MGMVRSNQREKKGKKRVLKHRMDFDSIHEASTMNEDSPDGHEAKGNYQRSVHSGIQLWPYYVKKWTKPGQEAN